ncbi:MAG: NAD(P)/FAD-dependent oxidoreductase [Acidobacteria bacterium]|nr:NAD(P)/FAD-dependent oxidoreductase [Acidobacteriota bacterium]
MSTASRAGAPSPVIIAGAGPAGLTAAYELGRLGHAALVFEADDIVGGISRSVVFNGCRLDIGGHRFFTKVREVESLWHEMLGDDLLVRPRMSRIYYRGRFFDYPLRPLNALSGLGLVEAARVLASYVHAQVFPIDDERTFDAWVSNRFGRRLFEIFFKTYTEKVWGMPCSEISAAWAVQRIRNLDLKTALRNAFFGQRGSGGAVVTSLIEQFYYPRLGPGMMWERCRDLVAERGILTHMGTRVVAVHHDDGRVTGVEVDGPEGRRHEPCGALISSMPVGELVRAMVPAPPPAVLDAAASLRYRDFLIVGLIVNRAAVFPDNWIYVHSPEVRVGRVQSFKNWSPAMVDDPAVSFIGLEYFVNQGDDLWRLPDDELVALGTREAETIGLFEARDVGSGTVVRMPRAYPVYDGDYERHVETLRGWIDAFDNLFTVGRNGQHRYNNQDHSMLTGLLAARNVAGARFDVWGVNEEQSFHEEVRDDGVSVRDRLTPQPVADDIEAFVREAFPVYDEVALGGAFAVTAMVVLGLATLLMLSERAAAFVPMLSLLGNFLFGYAVSWPGLALGMVEAGVWGFALGWAIARLVNVLTTWTLKGLERRLAALSTLEAIDGGTIELR